MPPLCRSINVIKSVIFISAHLDIKTACTVATFIVHSKLDLTTVIHFTSIFPTLNSNDFNVFKTCLARAVPLTPLIAYSQISTLVRIKEQIEYKITK